jgi:hypothetical protein
MHIYNHSVQGSKAGGLRVQGYIERLCLKNKTKHPPQQKQSTKINK